MKISHNTVALITGASSGIGRALALELAHRGVAVALLARRAGRLQEVAHQAEELGARALPIPCDITSPQAASDAVAETIARFGRLDVLINNAGHGHFAYIEETPPAQIESVFRANVFSLWYTTAPAIRQMRSQGSGHIINIASMAGRIGYPANAAYVAAKHAVVGFTRALRTELAGTGIEATVVSPGGVLTEWAMVTEGGPMVDLFAYEHRRGAEIAVERNITPAPALPILTPEEVARAITEAIGTPVPELFTHPGSRDLVLAYEQDQRATEQTLEPFWLANREGYAERQNAEGKRQK